MKFGTQTKTDMLSLTITQAEVYGKKTPKIKCEEQYRFKKTTLYEREVEKKQKFFLFADRSFHTHTTGS
jgi:hypothetical protein